MACCSHWLKLCPLFLLLTSGMCEHHVVKKKGVEAVIACESKTLQSSMGWQMKKGSDYVNLTVCNIANKGCVDSMPDQYRGEVSNKTESRVYLHITRVRINETEFRCYAVTENFETIHLEVYEEPSQPVCENVTVDYSRNNLLFKCLVGNVYPSVNATLHIRGVHMHEHDTVSHHCSHEKQASGDNDTFTVECIWRISASRLEPISYKYFVKVLPHVTHHSKVKIHGAVSEDNTFKLSSPTAVIDYKNCPVGPGVRKGKIEFGSKATCRCMLETPGFPPGHAQWYDGNKYRLGLRNTSDHSSTLIIYGVETDASYQCRGDNALKSHLDIGPVYTPEFYGSASGHESPRWDSVAGIVIGFLALLSVAAFAIWTKRQKKPKKEDAATILYRSSSE